MIETGILDIIERDYTFDPEGVCFYIADRPGLPGLPAYESVTYAQLRVRAARLARAVDRMDVHRGMWVVADMENCSAFVYLLVAAAMGGFSVVALNTRLTELEKAERLREIHTALCVEALPVFDEQAVKDAIKEDMAFDRVERMDVPRWMRRGMGSFSMKADAVAMFTSGTTGKPKAAPLTWSNVLGAAEASNAVLNKPGEGLWQLALPLYHVGGMEIVMRSILNSSPFILYRKFNAAQLLRDVEAYGATHVSVVDKMLLDMLNENEIQRKQQRIAGGLSDDSPDDSFDPEEGVQEPLGLRGSDPDEVDAQSDDPFDDYDPFAEEKAGEDDAQDGEAASDACEGDSETDSEGDAQLAAATPSLNVPDPIDAIDPFEEPDEQEQAAPKNLTALARYKVILLGGSAPNTATLRRAVAAGARVYASYGMTETCSQVASRLVTEDYDGTLSPLPGYDITVVAPDAAGLGKLAVRGPGVMSDYLNARARFTADGFFLTGDSAFLSGRCVKVAERTEDMFVSGGENIYPEEIRAKLLQVPGVSDAYVFGDDDPEWGKRPVAVVEASEASHEEGFNLQLMTDDIRMSLANRLSRLYHPDHIIVVPEFPRSGIGKTDRRALRQLYEQRIDVRKMEIWRVKLPFAGVSQSSKAKSHERESLLVRVTDWQGRTGIGEDTLLAGDARYAASIEKNLSVMQNVLAPLVNDYVFVHPSQASVLFRIIDEAESNPFACSALESALWDLYGKVVKRSISRLIGGRECVTETGSLRALRPGCVPGGMLVGPGGKRETLAKIRYAVEAGYTRVKVAVGPGQNVEAVKEARKEFPDLVLVLDAHQSFTEDHLDVLKALDSLDAACLVDPLDPAFKPKVGPQDYWTRMVRLQRDMRTPICLDSCWTTADELKRVLNANPALRCVAVKLGKFGGVQPALEFYWWARDRGIALWMGGMCDTGVSKRLHAAFSMLPGMNIPGEISDNARCFALDVTKPPLVLERGVLDVNPAGHEYGLGCDLDDALLAELSAERITVE